MYCPSALEKIQTKIWTALLSIGISLHESK